MNDLIAETAGNGHEMPSVSLDLDEMNEEHLDYVLEIERRVFSNPWHGENFRNAMARPGSLCLVPVVDGGMVGYSVGFFSKDEFHLADFAVHPDRQNRGLGTLFLNVLLEHIKERTARVATLEVRVSNLSAISLYRKAGFQTVAIRKDYYSKPKEDAFVLVKALYGVLSEWLANHSLSSG